VNYLNLSNKASMRAQALKVPKTCR